MRLHEVAKALGSTAKALMMELEKLGYTYKTHMAVLEEKALEALHKKHPSLKEKLNALAQAAAEAPTEPKKPRATKAKASKVVTSRTKKTTKPEETEPSEPSGSVAFVQREEGQAGTVTLEQKVVAGGVLRRRRVEGIPTPPPPPMEVVSPSQVEETLPEPEVLEPVSSEPAEEIAESRAEEAAPAQQKPTALPVEPAAEAPPVIRRKAVEPTEVQSPPPAASSPSPQTPPPAPVVPKEIPKVVPSFLAPASGRNLSSPSRLKIIETPPPSAVPARPVVRPAASSAKPVTDDKKRPVRPGTTPPPAAPRTATETTERDTAVVKKKPAFGRGAEEAASRLTKRDLMGMIEEVEVTRPMGRRMKKPAKVERKQTQITTPGASKRKIRIDTDITVADLADRMGMKASDVIRKLISLGQMATIHQRLEFDTASLIASEYGYEVQNVAESAEQMIQAAAEKEEDVGSLELRAPIVTIMGHVDHGKTSLLDYIRKTRVAAGEAGGITQHIGAYQVLHNSKPITFIDTPGHAAFTAMRARGASITDIVILVVAADEGVKPQTLEALAHAQAAKVPIIVAINKMDKPEANPERVTQELSGHHLVPEEWGGDTMYVKVSAHAGTGIENLLESVLLQAEVLDLKANKERLAKGVVIESRLDKGKGPVASAIIQNGTLSVGSYMVCGPTFGRVRALFDHQGRAIESAGPSTPVEILGFESVPAVGDALNQVSDDSLMRRASELAQLEQKRIEAQKAQRLSLEDMYKKMQSGEVSELRVVLKGDVQGSLEAIADSLLKIKHEKVKVNIIYKAVGAVTESDVDLAVASQAIVFGFNVRPTAQAKQLAQNQGIQIKTYEIIYELIDEVKKAMGGLLAPITKENLLGTAEVREVFTVSKVGPIAGCFVKTGKIQRNANARVIRDNVVVYTSKIASLRRFKDDAKEVAEGFECGIRVEDFSDLKAGDIIECFENIEIRQAVG